MLLTETTCIHVADFEQETKLLLGYSFVYMHIFHVSDNCKS